LTARIYTASEVDAAIEALGDPERFAHAQEVVTHAAPGLQRVLAEALAEGGWFGDAHRAELARVAAVTGGEERLRAVETLLAEETRLGMLVGVAVGFELANELAGNRGAVGAQDPSASTTAGGNPKKEET
jgi:hypothetical protein